MKVKDFKFKDIKKISTLLVNLELTKKDINDIVDVLTGAKEKMLATQSEVEQYLINNVEAKERKELYEKHENDFEKLREYALEHKGVDVSTNLIDVILKLIEILAHKFEVIAEFIAYYLEDYNLTQVLDFDEEQSVEALTAVFSDAGFLKFFSRLFNLK